MEARADPIIRAADLDRVAEVVRESDATTPAELAQEIRTRVSTLDRLNSALANPALNGLAI